MGELVNLRAVRKRRAREEAGRQADANRALFGRAKAERDAEAERRARESRALDGHRREGADET
jgi:hypothetical protein